MEFAIEMFGTLERFNKAHNTNLRIRVGINSGSVVAGVIGAKKFTYDVWGDAVNVASRMESTGLPNQIQVSQSTYDILKNQYVFDERGKQNVKGKGLMITYLYRGRVSNTTNVLFGSIDMPIEPAMSTVSESEDEDTASSANLEIPKEEIKE